MPTPPAADADDRLATTRQSPTDSEPVQTRVRVAALLRSGSAKLRFVTSGDNGQWLPLRLWLHIALFFGIAVASVFVLWVIFEGVFAAGLKDELKVEVIRLILYIIAGIGGVFALVIAYRRQGLNEAAEVRVERAEAREESKVFNERFKGASEQMSSDHAANRLAGVYAMAGLADDWDQGRQTCINVLCAYLRMPFDPPSGQQPPEDADGAERAEYRAEERARSQEAQVRETIISVIRSRLRNEPVEGRTWHGCDFDFTKAHFDDADFSGIRVTGGVMSFEKIVHVSGRLNFQSMVVTGGLLAFDGAVLYDGKVDLTLARFSDGAVHFATTVFAGGEVDFSKAEFSGGELSFFAAKFSGSRVHFVPDVSGGDISFTLATFSGGQINFSEANFSGGRTGFSGANFSGGVLNFYGARFSGGRIDFSLARFVDGEIDVRRVADGSNDRPIFSRFEGGVPECLKLPPDWVEAVHIRP